MITGLDLNQRIQFVSEDDKTDPKTMITFRPLSGSEKINISGLYSGGKIRMTGDFLLGLVKAAVISVKDPDLDKTSPENEKVLMNFLDLLPSGILVELGSKIQDLFELSGETQKNS